MAPPPMWVDPVVAEIWALVGGFPIVARTVAAWWEVQESPTGADLVLSARRDSSWRRYGRGRPPTA